MVGISDTWGMDVHTLIERTGGVGRLASALGVSHSTVCDWKRLGRLPSSRAIEIGKRLGLSVEAVAALARATPESVQGQ